MNLKSYGTIMRNSFSPSINIIRDQDKEFKYIPTSNAERVILQLNESINAGIKSFYLVGTYGTGKSAFLWAFEKQLEKGERIFKTPISFNGSTKYNILNIVGDYCSLEDSIKEALNITSKKGLFEELSTYYKKIHSANKGLIIVIDEFGKFLEYASQNNPEKELYLIQRLAEFANDHRRNIVFITTLHQGFDAYGNKLDGKIKNEWDKVRGRLKEISFNEPVEQLLHLAATFLNGNISNVISDDFNQLFDAILKSRVYPLNNALSINLAQKLFPLDLLSAGIIARSLQKYGQNERSLFTFLETANFSQYIPEGELLFNLNSVYDYLLNNYYSFLSSKYNPDYIKWSIIRNSIERCEIIFERESESKGKLIKTIGLLNLFAPHGARINMVFLNVYGKIALGLEKIEDHLKHLETKKIIKYQSYSDTYVLFEGTDIDIDLELNEAENYVAPTPDIISQLKEHFDLPFISARASYLKNGTPRFFEFILSAEPIVKKPTGEIDGYINLVFNKNNVVKTCIEKSKESNEAILYAVYGNTAKIEEIVKEINKIDFVLENKVVEDRVAQRELRSLKSTNVKNLNELVIDSLFDKDSKVRWVFKRERPEIISKSEFNKVLSKIIDEVYPAVPVYLNELVNREKLTSSINLAKKNLLQRLLNNWDKDEIGFEKEKYPPEKTIYLSLLAATKIHRVENEEYTLAEPLDQSFKALWEKSEEFFKSSKVSRRSILELEEILSLKPFKMKKGFIDFWIPIYLFIKRDDYALFDGETYIPNLNSDVFEALNKNPQDYFIKAFDIQGIRFDLFNKYRSLINASKEEKVTIRTFIATIRPFLTFYRELPDYCKKTKRLTKEAMALRDAIANAKDPEKTFFEDFPSALSFTTQKLYDSPENLEEFTRQLQNCIKEIRTCYSELINRIEAYLLSLIGNMNLRYPDYQIELTKRYSSINKYLLLPHQKSFYRRLILDFNERDAWISSIVGALMNKNLEHINDDEEEVIYERLNNTLKEFDNLCDFAKMNIDTTVEEAIRIEISSLENVLQKKIIRMPKLKEMQSNKLEKEIRNYLQKQNDKSINQFVLIKLLKEQIENE